MENKKYLAKPIGYKSAADHLDLLYMDWKDSKMKLLTSAGGMFRLVDLTKWESQGDNFSGIMCWFCLDEDSNFFLAIEPRFNFQYDEERLCEVQPVSENLLIPNQILSNSIFEGNSLNSMEFEKRLRSYRDDMSVLWNKKATNAEVYKWKENFLKNDVLIKKDYSSFGFTFFPMKDIEGNNNLSPFLSQPKIKMVRYYFGLTDYPKNKLRVILVPVNWRGKNIESNKGSLIGEENLLQYSWPPRNP